MTITTISDTHTLHYTARLEGGDILIFAGDMSHTGKHKEVGDFIEWLIRQATRYKHVIFISGNHDKCFDPEIGGEYMFDSDEMKVKPLWLRLLLTSLPKNVHYLENESVEIEGLKIWGSPITPTYGYNWAFNVDRGEDIAKVWKEIPMDTDIVVTHGPAAYKLDHVPRNMEYTGCEDLRYVIDEIKPKLHICGHIHEGYGIDYNENTVFVNASYITYNYRPINKPQVIELDPITKEVIKINGYDFE
jgi:Icc-related predicted phosphoesterase